MTDSKQNTKNYTATQPINHDGTQYQTGATLKLNERDAKFLLMAGCVVVADNAKHHQPIINNDQNNVAEPVKDEVAVKTNSYDGWLKADLSAELTKRGIEHDPKAKNAELEKLLMADDESQT